MRALKRLSYPVLTALSALLCMGFSEDCRCQNPADWRTLPPGTFIDEALRLSGDTVGCVVGNFTGAGVDTLYCIAIGCSRYAAPADADGADVYANKMDTYRLSGPNPALAPLYITDHPELNFIKVDDLDNDGMDELQFLHNSATSSSLSYGAYDYFNGEWVRLTRPVSFSTLARDDSDTMRVFQSTSATGSVLVYEDDFLPVEDPVEMVTVPKIIPIARAPIPHRYDSCFSLPGGRPVPLPVKLSN